MHAQALRTCSDSVRSTTAAPGAEGAAAQIREWLKPRSRLLYSSEWSFEIGEVANRL